jgi:hypothetical protein
MATLGRYLPPCVQSAIVEHVKLSNGGHLKFDISMSVWCGLIREGWSVVRAAGGAGYSITGPEPRLFGALASCPCFTLKSMTTTVCKASASSGMRTCTPLLVVGRDLCTPCVAVAHDEGTINIDVRLELKPRHDDLPDPKDRLLEYAEVLRGLVFRWVAEELCIPGVTMETYPGLGPRCELTSADAFNYGFELDRIVAFVGGVMRSGVHAVPWHFAVLGPPT